MSRPSYSKPVKATTTITVPPDWFISISALSRKTYHQAVFINIKTSTRNSATTFKSDVGSLGPMPDAVTGATSSPVAPRDESIRLEISAFYSEVPGKLTAKQIRADQYASSAFDIHESVKPPTASPDVPDYVTYSIFVEDTSDAAQVAGSGKYDDSAITIHLVKTNPNPIPPPPPKDVIPGYNPNLDLPRPSTLTNYLRAYDVVFLIDDSGSMQGQRWTEATQALNSLANWIIENGWDSDGIDIFFLNSDYRFQFRQELVNGVQDKDKVIQALANVSPNGGTPTGKRTKEILGAHVDKLNATRGTPAYGQLKPLDLIVITDGEANDNPPFELPAMLLEAANKIRTKPVVHHPNSMGVQFVQIGGEEAARQALIALTQIDTGNMVDSVPYKGPGSINAASLERILLGGLHPNIRALTAP